MIDSMLLLSHTFIMLFYPQVPISVASLYSPKPVMYAIHVPLLHTLQATSDLPTPRRALFALLSLLGCSRSGASPGSRSWRRASCRTCPRPPHSVPRQTCYYSQDITAYAVAGLDQTTLLTEQH